MGAVSEDGGNIAQHSNLHQFAANREPYGAANQHGYQYVGPEYAICCIDERCECDIHITDGGI